MVNAVDTDDCRATTGKSGAIAIASTPSELAKIIGETVRDLDWPITDLGIRHLK